MSLIYVWIIGFCVGIGATALYDVSPSMLLWLGVMGMTLSLWWRHAAKPRAVFIKVVIVILSGFVLGSLRMGFEEWFVLPSTLVPYVGSEVTLTGLVSREPDIRARTQQLYVTLNNDETILVTTDRFVSVKYGDVVRVQGELSVPESFTTELGRTFDYGAYLKARDIYHLISFAEVTVTGSEPSSVLVSVLLNIKKQFIQVLEEVVPPPEVALGEGLLLGVKRALPDELEEDFRQAGIIHIVVLSGYNVMLVVAFTLFILSFFLSLRARMVVGIVAIVCFALLVGLSATVVRASIMASLLLVAQALGRRYDVMRGLFIAGTIMLILNPYLLLSDVGFQLSFMATLGLILLVPEFESTAATRASSLNVRAFFLATLATQIAVLPLLLFHIGEVSTIAIVVNMLVLPVVPIAMLLTFATGIVALVSSEVAMLIGYLATFSLSYIIVLAKTAAALPFAAIQVPPLSVWWVPTLYAVLGMLYFFFKKLRSTTHLDELTAWQIEEEAETKSGAPQRGAPPQSDTPIFFR